VQDSQQHAVCNQATLATLWRDAARNGSCEAAAAHLVWARACECMAAACSYPQRRHARRVTTGSACSADVRHQDRIRGRPRGRCGEDRGGPASQGAGLLLLLSCTGHVPAHAYEARVLCARIRPHACVPRIRPHACAPALDVAAH
jgi:hypothetical protein